MTMKRRLLVSKNRFSIKGKIKNSDKKKGKVAKKKIKISDKFHFLLVTNKCQTSSNLLVLIRQSIINKATKKIFLKTIDFFFRDKKYKTQIKKIKK